MKKTISVLMATYNGAQFIRQQLDSIVQQIIHPDEIIVIDDCFNDKTLSILHEYKLRFANSKIISNTCNLEASYFRHGSGVITLLVVVKFSPCIQIWNYLPQ